MIWYLVQNPDFSTLIQAEMQSSNQYADSSAISSLGVSEKACNECSRRKGRCDRQLPECGPCARNKRHCLYQKDSKSPLTRRHMTELESRLQLTETRLRHAEHRASAAEAILRDLQATTGASLNSNTTSAFSGVLPATHNDIAVAHAQQSIAKPSDHDTFVRSGRPQPQDKPTEASTIDRNELEQPPSEMEDFSWDEQSNGESLEGTPGAEPNEGVDGSSVTDGMGSLSVEDKRAGYMGLSSGSAMLRLLMPHAKVKQRRRSSGVRFSAGQRIPSVTSSPSNQNLGWIPTPVWYERRINELDLDAAINSYFVLYHQSYPIVHEPTFRAQYAQVIPRPSGRSWNALAYIIASIGLFTTSVEPTTRDLDLFEAAKSNITIDSLETGNITLVQALTLIANYIQKRDKPNSGYNFLGLALHMAMGLGLHKEFQDWKIPPLQLEIRRRVWWTIFNLYTGCVITFGRPLAWPASGVEVALPLNCDDHDLTNASHTLPLPQIGLTTHSAIAAQARFHLATSEIYSKIVALPFPTARQLLDMDDARISPWHTIWVDETPQPRFALSRSVMEWRYRNFRIIMYRPFVIRKVLQARLSAGSPQLSDPAADIAYSRCLTEAKETIQSINQYWSTGTRNCMASWYGLYFLFQACMSVCLCLRNQPESTMAQDWREQLTIALAVMQSMWTLNPSSRECHDVVLRLCSDYLPEVPGATAPANDAGLGPVEESPATQMEELYPLMWPSANMAEMDMLLENDNWTSFLDDYPLSSPNSFNHMYDEHPGWT